MIELLMIDELRKMLCCLLVYYSLIFLLSTWGFYNDIKKEKTIEKDGLK